MNIFLKNLFILVFLFGFVIPQSFAIEFFKGPKVARVITARAIVYGDENLSIPLGYIPNGKVIAVGPVRKNLLKDYVPVIVSGRLAYLETKDIQYEEEKIEQQSNKLGEPKEHDIDIIITKPEDKLNENNSVYFHVGQYAGGSEVLAAIQKIENVDQSWFTSMGVLILHRNSLSRNFYGLGFEYDWITAKDLKFQVFMLNTTYGYSILKNPLFSIDLFGNLDITTGTDLKITNNNSIEPTGFFIGPKLGIRLNTTPNTKYKIYGELSYRQYKVYGLETLQRANDIYTTQDDDITGINSISGVNYTVGISFDL
jgi:hypothetical protein